MDRDSNSNSKKRAREDKPKTKRHKKKKTTTAGVAAEKSSLLHLPPLPSRELGVFEFPWQEEPPMIAEIDHSSGSDLRDVFFASLVDGCRAAIWFPGDRLSPSPAPIDIPDGGSRPSDLESEGVDCIWSCALREPLSVYSKTSLV